MKTVVIEKPTRDVDGLLTELRKLGPVVSVGSDARKTYVYLEETETQDPAPVVKAWADVPEIHAESMNPIGTDGIPIAKADGEDVHQVMIQKTTATGEVVPDNNKMVVATPQPVALSERKVRLQEGLATISVGPSEKTGDVYLDVSDASGKMKSIRVHLRFVAPTNEPVESFEEAVADTVLAKEPEPEAAPDADVPPEVRDRVTLWQKLKSMLGF